MSMTRTDEHLSALLSRSAAGDSAAFDELFRSTSRRALDLAHQVVRDPDQAEEALQDAFMELWSNAHRFNRARGSARNWILMAVRHRAIDKVRRTQRDRCRTTTYGLRHQERDLDTTSDAVGASLDGELIRDALRRLTHDERIVLHLSYWHELSHHEIAATLDLPLGTVKTRIRRGVANLRSQLAAG